MTETGMTALGTSIGPEDDFVPSPCISVCKLAPERTHCTGCLRTLAEIRAWKTLPSDEKRAILKELEERRTAAHVMCAPHHGKHSARAF